MLTHRHLYTTFLASLALVFLSCAPALAGQIGGVTVDIGDFKEGFDGDRLVDGKTSTAWIGGGRSSGPGKWIELTFPAPVKLKSLSIANGNQAKGQFNKNRRVTRGFIKYPDESRQQFTLKDAPGIQKIDLNNTTAESIKIVILGVAPSSRDKSIGKAKVAVSEITVFGDMDESAVVEDVTEKEPVVVEEVEEKSKPTPLPNKKTEVKQKKAAPAPASKVAAKPAEAQKKQAPVKPKAAPAAKPAPQTKPAKQAVKPKVTPTKTASKPKPAPKPKTVAKPVAKPKTAPKAAPKKVAKASAKPSKAKPKPKATASASAPGITYLKSAVPVPESKPFNLGQISPWLNLELVAQIKRYLGLLTTLHDSYPDVFVSTIRNKERATFIAFQDEMRASKKFGQHHMAQLDHIALSFDKPVITDEAATVRAHGPYRYYIGNQAYEFQVDAVFYLTVEDNKWLISAVQPK